MSSGSTNTNTVNTDTVSSRTTNGNLNLTANGTGNIVVSAGKSLSADNITSTTPNGNLILTGNGTGTVVSSDNFTVASGSNLFANTLTTTNLSTDLTISTQTSTNFISPQRTVVLSTFSDIYNEKWINFPPGFGDFTGMAGPPAIQFARYTRVGWRVYCCIRFTLMAINRANEFALCSMLTPVDMIEATNSTVYASNCYLFMNTTPARVVGGFISRWTPTTPRKLAVLFDSPVIGGIFHGEISYIYEGAPA